MNSPPPRGQGYLPCGTGGAGISDQAPRGIGTCQARKCRLKGTAGWGRGQPPSHQNNPFWQELALMTAGCISKEAKVGKTKDNMAPRMLRAGERRAPWSRDGELVFILERRLLRLRRLDPSEQTPLCPMQLPHSQQHLGGAPNPHPSPQGRGGQAERGFPGPRGLHKPRQTPQCAELRVRRQVYCPNKVTEH